MRSLLTYLTLLWPIQGKGFRRAAQVSSDSWSMLCETYSAKESLHSRQYYEPGLAFARQSLRFRHYHAFECNDGILEKDVSICFQLAVKSEIDLKVCVFHGGTPTSKIIDRSYAMGRCGRSAEENRLYPTA